MGDYTAFKEERVYPNQDWKWRGRQKNHDNTYKMPHLSTLARKVGTFLKIMSGRRRVHFNLSPRKHLGINVPRWKTKGNRQRPHVQLPSSTLRAGSKTAVDSYVALATPSLQSWAWPDVRGHSSSVPTAGCRWLTTAGNGIETQTLSFRISHCGWLSSNPVCSNVSGCREVTSSLCQGAARGRLHCLYSNALS